jgi:hypothetical protein
VANFGLTNAVNSSEPLFQSVRVPWKVVVDHQMRATLKVHAFAGSVVRDHHPHNWIGIEGGNRRAPGLARDSAMDGR